MNDDYKKLIYIDIFILHYTNLTDFDRRHLSLQYLTPSQFNLHFLRHEKLRLQVSQILKGSIFLKLFIFHNIILFIVILLVKD